MFGRNGYFLRLGELITLSVFLFYTHANAESDKQMASETAIYSALSMGTAWAITSQHVVTNYHVVANTINLRLVTPSQIEIPVELVASDQDNDLAVLAITGRTRLGAPLPVTTHQSQLGSKVFTIGYPHPDLMGTSPKLTAGHINALTGIADDPSIYQVSVPVQSGNSGGPLLNMRGEVIAVITSKLNAKKMFERTGDVPQNVNYAVKIDNLNALLKKLNIINKTRQHGFKNEQSLEKLAGKSLKSVLIIAGDSTKVNHKTKPHNFTYSEKPEQNNIEAPITKKRIILYSLAEPGNHDLQENIVGSSTIEKYSASTLELLQTQLLKMFGENIVFTKHSGKDIRKFIFQLEDQSAAVLQCKKYNADKIIASYSEKNPGVHFRYVSYRIFDCLNNKGYSKKYTIERNERYDGFGYEMALYSTFKDFLIKGPPYINWAMNAR